MNESEKSTSFQYTYSAREQEELKKIRSKYIPKEENKMDRLRQLDAGVNRKATVYALTIGIVGVLILGTGMSCCMVWGGGWLVPGIIVGILGMAILGLAYPVHGQVLKKERERIAPEVLRLTEELIK